MNEMTIDGFAFIEKRYHTNCMEMIFVVS